MESAADLPKAVLEDVEGTSTWVERFPCPGRQDWAAPQPGKGWARHMVHSRVSITGGMQGGQGSLRGQWERVWGLQLCMLTLG